MAITTESGVIAALPGQQQAFSKNTATGKGAGSWHSLWTVAGQPGAGAAPGSVNGAIPTDATAGAFPFTNPTGGLLSYLLRLFASGTQMGTVTLYDRLWHNSGLSATVTTLQSITQPALTRYTTGEGNELWVEIYTSTTAAATATVIYTNQAGIGSRSTTVAIPASTVAGQMIPVPLAAGDTGVRSVQSVQLSGSMTAGNWGLTLLHDIASFPIPAANSGVAFDVYDLGMPQILDDACLAFLVLLSGTATPAIQGEFSIGQG